MARIRSIKPEFWTDGKVVALSSHARLLFIGCWNFARCDNGHIEDDAMSLKLRILPADKVDATELLNELVNSGLVVRYQLDDRTFLKIKRFNDHQKTDPRWENKCPYCALQNSPKLAETPLNSSQEGIGRDGIGRDRKGKEKTSLSEPSVSDAAVSLAKLLIDKILINHPTSRLSKTCVAAEKSWPVHMQRLMTLDGRSEDEIKSVIAWCQADTFWGSNILSAQKLREKWDTLVAQMARKKPGDVNPYADWEDLGANPNEID